MPDRIRVRAYNIRFGDAFLVTVPDAGVARHVLVDFGNALATEGGHDSVFEAAFDDIMVQTGGKPVDLFVMTHEHMDHVQGAEYLARKKGKVLKAAYAWLTASAAPGYYDSHHDAREKKSLYLKAFAAVEKRLSRLPAADHGLFGVMAANNRPGSTKACVEFLRTVAPTQNTTYVHRGCDLAGRHPFTEASFEIWAPEEDTSIYYGRRQFAVSAHPDDGAAPAAPAGPAAPVAREAPPPGVDAGAFQDLVERRRSGWQADLLAIDRAENNTSVVFAMTWRGKRLVFTGDAELRSWSEMERRGVLKPADFMKVSHHGSHNGTPEAGILDLVLVPGNKARRRAAVSTWTDTYSGIPHDPTNGKLRERARLFSTLDDTSKPWFDVFV